MSKITGIDVQDIRFRFERLGSGSDAANPHPDYSNAVVTLQTPDSVGTGIAFTIGLGNDQVCQATKELAPLVIGENVGDVVADFATFWRRLSEPLQSRWIAPGAGAYRMAAGAIANAVYDAWSRKQELPLWRALAQLNPEQIINMLDMRYVEHLLSREEALEILRAGMAGKNDRIAELSITGIAAYHTTWIGSTEEQLIREIRDIREAQGITRFKLKVGGDLEHDRSRLTALRSHFGSEIELCADANQVWSVPQAIEWMRSLAEFDLYWIEEPTAPDSVDGHRAIRQGLADTGIDVVTGESCPNSHVAGALIAGGGVDRFQVDACRVIGPAENILIMLIAAKYGVPICPHAGGSGLDELVPHLALFNVACINPDQERVLVEQVGLCADHMVTPAVVQGGRVQAPSSPGYFDGIIPDALERYAFPDGAAWR